MAATISASVSASLAAGFAVGTAAAAAAAAPAAGVFSLKANREYRSHSQHRVYGRYLKYFLNSHIHMITYLLLTKV